MPKGNPITVKRYNRARGNLLGNIRYAENQGAIYDRSTVPDIPEKVTMADVKELQKLNKRKNRYANETWVSPEGEEITGTEYRAMTRKEKREFMGVAETTYISMVQSKLDEAVKWVDSHSNPNHITPEHMDLIVEVWENSLSWLDDDFPEIAQELNDFLKLNQGLISTALEVIQYESDGNGDNVQAEFEFLQDLLDWTPA